MYTRMRSNHRGVGVVGYLLSVVWERVVEGKRKDLEREIFISRSVVVSIAVVSSEHFHLSLGP
jgi:hypothetical protein